MFKCSVTKYLKHIQHQIISIGTGVINFLIGGFALYTNNFFSVYLLSVIYVERFQSSENTFVLTKTNFFK